MIDNHGRTIDYIRISVTDRCNLRCMYCMPEDGVETVAHQEVLSYDEILRLGRILLPLDSKRSSSQEGNLLSARTAWLL